MIYLFDKDEKLIKIVRKSAVKTALQKYALTTERYVSDRLTVEHKGLNADELEQVEYMAIQTMEDAHTFHYFYVAQKFSDELTTLIGVQSGIEELRKSPVYAKRPQNAFARDVITDLLAGTNWQARFVGETTPHSTNFYYTSVFDALKKVCEVWDLEMQFFVEMNGNRIGARYIDFKRRIGEAVGKRVVYGHNALQILQEVERTNIFTALIGRGKGEETGDGYGRKITFENVVWSTTQGKPVNKPKGQKHLELPLMTRQYGIKNADGSMRPKIGFVDFSEEENPEVLIERTYKALIDAARPQLTLKTSSVYLKEVKVGDTIRVVRHDKKLDYDTRIFEITFNRLNNQSSDIKLGDRIGESNEAKAQKIADKAVEQFVNNEFSNFVQNLPDYLPSADGFNNNWYGTEDPTVQYSGKVLINDIWYKPDPEHEGHKIMLRWSGEVWEEILRTYDSEALRDRIAEEIAQVNTSMQAQSEEHDRQVADILSKTQSVEALANQAKTDAANAIVEATQMVETAKSLLSGQISNVSTDLSQTKEAIKLLATKATVDTLTGRISNAESSITQNANEISKRLTSTQVEQIITDKGYATVAVLENKVKETADSFSRTISETKALIPSDATNNNLWVQSRTTGWFLTEALPSGHVTGQNLCYKIFNWGDVTFNIEPDFSSRLYRTVTFSAWVKYENVVSGANSWNTFNCFKHLLVRKNSKTGVVSGTEYLPLASFEGTSDWKYVTYTYDYSANTSYDQLKTSIKFNLEGVTTGVAWITGVKVELGSKATRYSLAVEDTATVTALHNVTDTVDSHTRTIGSVGETGSILDNVSKVTQTANGLVQEVSGSNGLKTQVSTLAGSYAITNLTNSGTVLNQLNLNKDGSVRIDGKLVQITGTTYIEDGVISSAKIASLDAGKITTGYLASARIATNSITGSHIAFDQAFFNNFMANEAYLKQIFAKNAFITSVQAVAISASNVTTGVLRATNGALSIDLNNAYIEFNSNAKIRFSSSENSIGRTVANLPKQYLRFETGSFLRNGQTNPASKLVIGSNSQSVEDSESEYFSGQRWWQTRDNLSMGELVADQVLIYSTGADRGPLVFNTGGSVKNFHPTNGSSWDIGTAQAKFRYMYIYDIYLQNGVRLGQALKDLANRVGHNGWGNNIS